MLLEQIQVGATVRRRDAVALARAVIECDLVRAAEAVLDADATLPARLIELLSLALEPAKGVQT